MQWYSPKSKDIINSNAFLILYSAVSCIRENKKKPVSQTLLMPFRCSISIAYVFVTYFIHVFFSESKMCEWQ